MQDSGLSSVRRIVQKSRKISQQSQKEGTL